jgi:hypothetical protein
VERQAGIVVRPSRETKSDISTKTIYLPPSVGANTVTIDAACGTALANDAILVRQ